jgi:hypothetical protein
MVILSLSLLVNCDNFKSKELSPEKKLELAEKCSKAGKAFFDDFIARNLPEGYLWDEPEYHYSSRLNTCLIHIRYVSPGTTSSHRNQVIDIFANKPLIYGWFERDNVKKTETLTEPLNTDVPNYKSVEYFKQKDKLFSE